MCGIVGVWKSSGDPGEHLREAVWRIRHRGPDGEGLFAQRECAMGHRRLSIVDVSHGSQPIRNETGSLAFIYNGEIYNHSDLAGSLRRQHVFYSRSDGEVVPHLYEESGIDGLSRLRGMFALAMWDGSRLVLARDRVGIKPLYWHQSEQRVVFASEIKALLPLAPHDSIREFPPGHWFASDRGLHPFPAQETPSSTDLADRLPPREAAAELLLSLESAVVRRLMSDVPVGVFLSGGLDSSLIAALMLRHVQELHSFSVGLPGSNDLRMAREVAAHLGTEHHEVLLDPEEVESLLPLIIYHLESYDADLVRSAVATYFLSREASRHVKVVLTGEGADELFAGYDYHRAYADDQELTGELWRSIGELHHINLQRVDRMTMAHGLEARVPFLDLDFIRLAMRVPGEWKLRDSHNKYLLRLAAEEVLPRAVAWRPKEQFDQGSGSSALLRRGVRAARTAEAESYHAMFRQWFPEELDSLVACWRGGRRARAGARRRR